MEKEKETLTVEVSRDFLFEACALVYRKWSEEFDLLKKVKKENNDGSTDWQQFHKHRLAHHTELEEKWRRRKDESSQLTRVLMRLTK